MDDPELRLSFPDGAALAQEFEQNLKHGRAYVRGPADVGVLCDCMLVLVHPQDGAELPLRAQAVMVSAAGVGIELRPFDEGIARRMRGFIEGEREPEAPPAQAVQEPCSDAPERGDALAGAGAPWPGALTDPPDADVPLEEAAIDDEELAGLEASMPSVLPSAPPDWDENEVSDDDALEAWSEEDDADAGEPGEADDDHDAEDDGTDADEDRGSEPPETELQAGPSRHERLRKLSLVQQQKMARRGELNDRVMLERLYGKNVWDPLLRNPRLTIPEVARIARKGTVPRPLLDLIVDNNAWIQAATVRRALLSNPRVNGEAIMKLMRITPKHELKTIMKSTAYSALVRDAAKKVHG